MQKRWLKDFEFHINPSTWNKAQDLVRDGHVKSLRELEKHFWVCLVGDGEELYEVEVMLTPHKIKAYTCECWSSSSRRLMCAHVAAALLKIRHFLQKHAENKTEVKTKSKAAGKLSVRRILEHADPDELSSFVQMYARSDRDFALALKTWFAGQFSNDDNLFLQVLDAAVPRTAAARPLRNPELRRLRKSLDALHLQLESSIEEGNYQRAFLITEAVMQRIPPLIGRLEENPAAQLIYFVGQVVEQVLSWDTQQLSPELNRQRRDAVTDWYMRPGFPASLHRSAAAFLGKMSDDDGYYQKVKELFDRHNNQAQALRLFLVALAHREMPEAVVRVLDHSTISPADIPVVLRFLQQAGYSKAASFGAAHFLKHLPLSQHQRRELEDVMLIQAEKDGDRSLLTQIMVDRYLQHPVQENLKRLKNVALEKDWVSVRQLLIDALRSGFRRSALLSLLADEQMKEALVEELGQETEIEHLPRFENSLLPEFADALQNRYTSLFDDYLKDHFGRQASLYIREAISEMLSRQHTELAAGIVRKLIDRYPERQYLAEELIDLFPTSQHKVLFSTTNASS